MNLLMENWRKYLGLGKEVEPEEVPEPAEIEDEQSSAEANLAMLVFRDEINQALMMFEMLGNGLDLDLLAAELDNRLIAEWEKIPEKPKMTWPRSPEMNEYTKIYDAWIQTLEDAIKFISGGHINRGFRPSADVYKLGSIKDTIAMALKQTAAIWKAKNEDTSDESLMENWRKYLKDKDLDELPLGATSGPIADPERETYKFKSPEEMEEYTRWAQKGNLHDLDITWEDFYHAMFSGKGRKLTDYADESAEEWEARRAEEESDETPT